jgi:hypothetical protein
VTSGFAYNVLRYDYDPKVSHRARIGPAAFQAIGKAWKRGETDSKKIADAARYFEEWHSLKKPASPQTLADLIACRPGLEYLRGREQLGTLDANDLRQFSYIPLAGACLEALDSTRTERKKSAAVLRTDLARGIISTILQRWSPDADGRIHLPGLLIGGLAEITADGAQYSEQTRRMLLPHELQGSGDAIRLFPAHSDSGCVDYLLALAFDSEPMPLDVLPRWAIDLASPLLAARCLQCCEADPQNRHNAGVHASNLGFDAASIGGIARWLLGPRQQKLPDELLSSLIERVSAPLKSERVLRSFWGNLTMQRGRRALDWIWQILGSEPRHFWRAFERHPLPVLPVKPTATGMEIAEQIQRLLKPAVTETLMSPFNAPDPSTVASGKTDTATFSGPTPTGDDWLETYQRLSLGLAEHASQLVMVANNEGRMLRRAEYEELLHRMENGRQTLKPKVLPPHIQQLMASSNRSRVRRF